MSEPTGEVSPAQFQEWLRVQILTQINLGRIKREDAKEALKAILTELRATTAGE